MVLACMRTLFLLWREKIWVRNKEEGEINKQTKKTRGMKEEGKEGIKKEWEEGDADSWVVPKISESSVAVTCSSIFYPNSTPGNRKEGSSSPRSRLHIHHVIPTNQRSVAQHLMRCLQEESKRKFVCTTLCTCRLELAEPVQQRLS